MTPPGVPPTSGLCPGCEKKWRPRTLVSSLHLLSCYHGLSLTCLGFVYLSVPQSLAELRQGSLPAWSLPGWEI